MDSAVREVCRVVDERASDRARLTRTLVARPPCADITRSASATDIVEGDDRFELGALERRQLGRVHLGSTVVTAGHDPAPMARKAPIPRRPTSARAAAVCPACQPCTVAALAGLAVTTRPNAVRA